MVKCSKCGFNVQGDIKICLNCGNNLNNCVSTADTQLSDILDFSAPEQIPNQIRNYFFKIMRYRVENELDSKGYRNYFDLYHSSGFYKKFDLRSQQLAEEIIVLNHENESLNQPKIDSILDRTLESFCDYFFINCCQSLHKMQLPEAILKYGNIEKETMDLRQMITDYLDFENEKDKIYLDVLKMPSGKLKNAKEAFLIAENGEKLFFVCDQTIFGSCNEGFAMTDKALYWKPHFNDPGNVLFSELQSIKKEGEWLKINGQFFNVNKTMNYKMMKLLQKLQLIFSE